MTNRDQIHNLDQLLKVTELAVAIQNEGIATVFVALSGHVNETEVRLYFPTWESNKDVDATMRLSHDIGEDDDSYTRGQNQKAIDRLEQILETRQCIDREGNVVDLEAKMREHRKKLFEQLKSEFEAA